jgi:hypothetical protein
MPGKHLQHSAVDTGDTPLDINGEDSERGAVAQEPVAFLKGSKCRLGLLAALFNVLQFGNLSAQCFNFRYDLICVHRFLQHKRILRIGWAFHFNLWV